ncbi:MAG: MMPL family transporter [bacterium]|nr:MMPL family transporter [bacterium]
MSTRTTRRLEAVAAFCVWRPLPVLAAAGAVMLLALAYASSHLTLRTSNLDLIDAELAPVASFRDFAAEFGTPNFLVIVFEGGDPRELRAAVDRIGERLLDAPGVRGVIDKLPHDAGALEIMGIDPYLASRDRGLFFIFVQPDDPTSSAETIAPFVRGVREVLSDAGLEARGVRAGLTGMPEYALDDREIIERDVSRLSAVAAGLILLLFVSAFGAFRRPLMVTAALLVGVGTTIGLVAFFPGHLTLLSAFFASILFGLGVDYGIHIVDRVEELVAAGRPEPEAIPSAIAALAPSLRTGALTTASVLLAMQLSGFKGFEELGLIAGVGVLVCLLTMVTVLPALLALFAAPARRERPLARRRIGRVLCALQSRRAAGLLTAAALLCLLAGSPGFDTDYLNLQPRDSEAVRLEREMVRRSDYSPEFAVFTAESEEVVKDLVWRLADDDTVAAVRSLRDFEVPGLAGALPELPPALEASLRSPAGRLAVYAYPGADVWQGERQEEFVTHMRSIDGEVTGMPILGHFMIERSKRALRITAVLGALLLCFWVWFDFRRLVPTLLAILPTVLAVASMHALMRLFGISFNPLNVMALPVVLGIAVDDGVHVVHRFLAERGDLARTLAGTGRSVFLTSMTTLAAFGTLAFTPHRGLASFAITLSLGVASAFVFSVLVLPQILSAVAVWRPAAVWPVMDGIGS